MQNLSRRMLDAGWVLRECDPGHWRAVSPENRLFEWKDQGWHPDAAGVLEELDKNEKAIREERYSRFTGTSRLSVSRDNHQPGLLTQWLARQGLNIHGNTVLRARAAPDPAGDELLYGAGARRVETLLQPWPEAPDTQRHLSSHLLICEHVADVLPKAERARTLKRLITHLHPGAGAYFSFYQMEALPLSREHRSLEDGYLFRHGRHEVFLKPSLPGRCAVGLQKILGGFTEEVDVMYDEIFCRWFPHE